MKAASIGLWDGKSSVTDKVPPAAAMSAVAWSSSPRGSPSQSGSVSSKQRIKRGVLNVEKRCFCLR